MSLASGRRSRLGVTTCWSGTTAPQSRRLILFDAHQDTVPTDGMTIPPFEPRIDGGQAVWPRLVRHQGRHGGDAHRLRPAGPGTAGRLGLVLMACTVDEEFTHTGSSRLAEMDHGADLAIVAEPTLLDIVDCHKGALRWKIRTQASPATARPPNWAATPSTGWRSVLESLKRTPTRSPVDPPPGAWTADLVSRANRGRTERQRRARLVRGRDRPPT